MSYTVEFRGRKIKNKRGKDDFYRKRVKSLPTSQNIIARSENGQAFRRSVNWDNVTKK
jgi:hypothetical protein